MGRPRRVEVSRVIPVEASVIFELLADPRQHMVLDGSGTLLGLEDGPERLSLGATFTMSMKMGVPYHVRNTVVAFVEDAIIAWRHFSPNVWRYDLAVVDGGTRVTESFTYDNATRSVVALAGFPGRNRRAMAATLARLDAALSASR